MRCETARTILELNLPRLGEADWRDLDAVEVHLKSCSECQSWWNQRSREDNRIARDIRAVPVPRNLASSIVGQFPPQPVRSRKRMPMIAGMVAASLVALAGIGLWLRPSAAPLDADALARLLDTSGQVDGPTSHERMEQLVDSFARLGVMARLPESLNYLQVISHGVTELQGQKVPQILFQSEENGNRNLVRLLVLDSKKFDLSQYSVEQNAAANRLMELVPDSDDGRFYYLLSTQELGRAPKY
jgi:hypothetical protein